MEVSQQTISETPSRDRPQLFFDVLHRSNDGRIADIQVLNFEGHCVQGGEPADGARNIEIAARWLAAVGLDIDERWSSCSSFSLTFPSCDRERESCQENIVDGRMKGCRY